MIRPFSFIASFGRTTFEHHPDSTIVDLVLEAVDQALRGCNIGRDQLDYIVTSSNDLWDGKTASNVAITEVVGAVMNAETRVASDGIFAVLHADSIIKSGQYETVLVVAHLKGSEGNHQKVSNWAFDPLYLQPLGVDYNAMSVLAQNIENEKSPVCHDYDQSDGACALVITSNPSLLQSWPHIKIKSKANSMVAHYPGRRDWNDDVFTKNVQQALHRINNDKRDSKKQSSMNYNDLSGFDCVALSYSNDAQIKSYDKKLKDLNFNGTTIPATKAPHIVRGLSRVLDTASHLQESRGRLALVHGQSGPWAQQECVMVLEADYGK